MTVDIIIEVVLFLFLIAMGVAIIHIRELFSAAMLTGIFSLLSAGLFTVMDAVDVAFTEAAVGAGMSTILVLATLALTKSEVEKKSKRNWLAITLSFGTGGLLLYGCLEMPGYGDITAPVHQHVGAQMLIDSQHDINVPNVVTAILASYRGFDTFGELSVIFAAGVAVTLLLAIRREDELPRQGEPEEAKKKRHQTIREMPILRTLAKILIPVIILFAVYVQAHGDFGPGGGFQAGVILASAFMMFAMIYGAEILEERIPHRWLEIVIPSGLLLYGGVGLVSFLSGKNFLDYSALASEGHAQHGQHLGILLVELGVGVTVSAVLLSIFLRFAARGRR